MPISFVQRGVFGISSEINELKNTADLDGRLRKSLSWHIITTSSVFYSSVLFSALFVQRRLIPLQTM